MPTFEYWVNPITGNNANAGTEAAPFATVRHAAYNSRLGLWTADDTVIVNVVPSGNLQAADCVRLWEGHNGANILVRSSTASPFTVTNNHGYLVEMNPSAKATCRVENCSCTRNEIVRWQGTEAAGRQLHITLANCTFTHARINSADRAAWIRATPAGNGSLTVENCTFTGWDQFFDIALGGTDLIVLDGVTLTSDATSAPTGAVSVLGAPIVRMLNCSVEITNGAVANQFQISGTTEITISDNDITMNTSGSAPIWVRTQSSGSTTIDCTIKNNSITATTGSGYALEVGRQFLTTSSRATTEAAGGNLKSCVVSGNSIVQLSPDWGCIFLMADTNDAVVRGNYFRVATLAETTNVHQTYMWGRRIRWENNRQQASLLAFGPEQKITGNVFVSHHRCILLGGTQGGSTTSGGGNNYTIQNNVMVATDFECYSDYGFLNAYPNHLGLLDAKIDRNYYAVLSGADGVARLTNLDSSNGLLATTLAELQNLWQQTALSGSGPGVYGVPANVTNDLNSVLVSGEQFEVIFDLCETGEVLTKTHLDAIWGLFNKSQSFGVGLVRTIVPSMVRSIIK